MKQAVGLEAKPPAAQTHREAGVGGVYMAPLIQEAPQCAYPSTSEESGLTPNAANYLVGQSRDGGELARGNRLADTEGFCKSQVTLNSRLGRQRAAAGMPQRFSQRPGGL